MCDQESSVRSPAQQDMADEDEAEPAAAALVSKVEISLYHHICFCTIKYCKK